eukprot:9857895-Karenia_brevis.AAC.1
MKKKSVIKLVAARDGDLNNALRNTLTIVSMNNGCVPETIRIQAQAAMDKEPLQLKKTSVIDGKQSIGHDAAVSNVNA